MRFLKQAFLMIGLGVMTVQGFAQSTGLDIKTMLETRDKEIKDVLGAEGTEYTDAQKESLKIMINDVIDFEAMSKTALGDTYSEITDDQRTEFVDLFSTIIKDNSLLKLEIYRATVSYNEVDVDGDNALVETMAELDEVRTPVNYKMQRRGNEWVIVDMSIDEVYTAESYNRQFQRIIRKKGFDGLMDTLRKRVAR